MRSVGRCVFAVLLVLAFVCTAAAESAFSLPVDFSPGMPLNPACYVSETEYKDPSIHVTLESGRKNDCDYWLARIRIADPSQLRTAAAAGFDENFVMQATRLAKRQNAVLAIDGDYFAYTGFGIVLRQGVLYMDDLRGERDVLCIDENGDFHVYIRPGSGEVPTEIDGKKVINAFHFGPALLIDGEIGPLVAGKWMVPQKKRQRMCLAQTGPLEYMTLCCAGPVRGSVGMTVEEFAHLAQEMGAVTAYNLDGGDSTAMVFNNEKINDVRNPNSRKLTDIVYFASAWDGGVTEGEE